MIDNHSHEQGALEKLAKTLRANADAVGEKMGSFYANPFRHAADIFEGKDPRYSAPALVAALPASAPVDGGLEAENARLRNYARRVSIAFIACSGGGSEMFTQIDGEFYADPEACRTRVEERFRAYTTALATKENDRG